jgi:PAS domain S-box-containing protein
MDREAPRTPNCGQPRTSSQMSGSIAGAHHADQPIFRRLAQDVRLWLTVSAVVVGAVALAAAVIWQSAQAAAQQRAANRWYAHTLEVLVEVGRFSTALSEVQRGARGYLLTADPRFLSSYRTGAKATPGRLDRLRALTADNPRQQRRLAALASEVATVIGLSEREVELEAAGRRAAALAIVRSGAANDAMERAQAISSAVVDEEQSLLAIRRAAVAQATSNSARITILLAFLGAGLLGVAAGLGWLAFAAAARARLAEVRAEAHEREAASAALLSLFIEEAPAAIAMFDRQMRYLAASRRNALGHGLPPGSEMIGRSHYEIYPDAPQRWRDIHARVLAGEVMSCDEDSFPRPDGRTDWVRWRMQPWRDAQGEIGGALLFTEDITAQVEAHRAHLAAEARLRAIVDTAADAIVVINEAGIIQSANPATETMFGYSVAELLGHDVSLLMGEPNRSAHDGYLAAYRETGQSRIIGVGREVEGLRKDGSTLPIDLAVAEWRIEGQRFFTGLLRDISARKIAEAERLQAERRERVVGELRHRINNMFTVICGLVTATARSQRDVAAYRDALMDRITAFAAAQVELARQAWSSMGLRELVAFELKPFSGGGPRVSLFGEELRLNGAAAESIAMVIHELATNAAKYGALSRPEGALEVRWDLVRNSAGEEHLVFEWIERGGPPVTPPLRHGFGSTVIESNARALGGAAQLDYAPEGLRCTIDVPAEHLFVSAQDTSEPAQ